MALPLAAASLAEIVDPHQGRTALAERRLTVLHPLSFRDDPTRILRGLELAPRLGLRFDSETEALARSGSAYLAALSPSRLLEAWTRLFPDASRVGEKLATLDRLGSLSILSPGLRDFPLAEVERLVTALTAPAGAAAATGRAVLAWLARRAGPSVELDLARRFGYRELEGLGERLARAESDLAAAHPPHELERAVANMDEIELTVLAATAPPTAAERASLVLAHWRALRLAIGGADLVGAGSPPGPLIGEALRRTRAARLDGEIAPEEELTFALAWLARQEAEA
jgi:tRNA nucleotidyltransferase (CCA-adding enzyme)